MAAFITRPMSFGERGAGLGDGLDDGAFDDGGIGRGRQIGFEHADLGGFLVGEILPAALRELLDGVLPLLHERADHLPRFAVVERPAPIDLAVDQSGLEHAQRDEADLIPTAHRIRDGGVELVDESHQDGISFPATGPAAARG